jgi:hypothetical protein
MLLFQIVSEDLINSPGISDHVDLQLLLDKEDVYFM